MANFALSLLTDLRAFSGIPFTHVFSAEEFGTYKVRRWSFNMCDISTDNLSQSLAIFESLSWSRGESGCKTQRVRDGSSTST
jgi:hypothetical protein